MQLGIVGTCESCKGEETGACATSKMAETERAEADGCVVGLFNKVGIVPILLSEPQHYPT